MDEVRVATVVKRRRSTARPDGAPSQRAGGQARRRLTVDAGWQITSVTKAAAAWFGAASADALVGLDARKLLPRQSPAFIAMETCMAMREPTRLEFRSDFFPDRRVEAQVQAHGSGVEVSFWDVRERHAARPAATAPGGRVESREAPDEGLEFTLAADWTIAGITKAAADWCGSTVDDLIGRDGREVNPAATALLGEAIEAALRHGKTTRREHPSTHVPGRWVSIEVSPSERGARVRFEDITARSPRKDGERGGRTPRPAEIVLLDRRGVIVAANAAWRAAVLARGLALGDAGVGAPYAAVGKALVKDIDEHDLQTRLEALLCGRLQQFEATYDIETNRGHELQQVRIAPLRIGEATYFAAIHEDLSERAKILATLHETSDQLLHAQEMERQRIAIELHDSMSQHLAGLVLGLGQLRRKLTPDQVTQALIDDMTKLTQLAIRETRVLSYLMNAAGDEDEELELSLRRFVDGFGRRTGLQASFRAQGPADEVGAAVRHTVFRVTQEALSNVYRHAAATKVSVQLVTRPREISLRISDDGRGIDHSRGAVLGQPLLGVGIAGMRARIEQLGGRLEIASGPRGGAVVVATIPLRSARRAAAAVA